MGRDSVIIGNDIDRSRYPLRDWIPLNRGGPVKKNSNIRAAGLITQAGK